MLPEIVEAVGDGLTVLFDSGIRTGVDIIKALSLGAKAVLVGRPAIYGLAVAGKVSSAKQALPLSSTDDLFSKEQSKFYKGFWRISISQWAWQALWT